MYLVTALLCFCLLVTFARLANSQIDLIENARVKIKARLQVVPNESEFLAREIELFETYSNLDARSLVEIKSPYDKDPSLNYYATKDGSKIEFAPRNATCRLVDGKVYLEALFGPLAGQNIALIDQWLSPIEGIPEHLIGLGRLLALIQREKKIGPLDSKLVQYIRGKASFAYSFLLQWTSNLELTVNAFYTDELSEANKFQHPTSLVVKFKARAIFLLDIYAVESTRREAYAPADGLDPTTLPLGVACASVQPARMAQKVPPKGVFTMDAELIDLEQPSAPLEQFIAYDANQQAFRRDTLYKSPLESVYLKSIYDLKKGRQYNVNLVAKDERAERQDSQDVEQPILQVNEMPLKQCVVAELEKSDYEALIPFERLAYAGAGFVRGRRVDIYETSSATLPALFFAPGRFVDTNDKWQLYDDAKDPETEPHDHQVAFYFARDGAPVQAPFSGTLVRVDVFRRRRLIKQINVFNFIWQLAQAPNGDSPESLFSLHHTCSSVFTKSSRQLTYSPDRSIHMSIELEFLLTTPRNGQQNLLVALQSTPVRNAAILRGLVASSKDLGAVQVVNLRSFLKTSQVNHRSQYTLFVSAQLVLADDDFFRPKMVSYGTIYANMAPIQSLKSFEHCFNEASRRRLSERVLFAFTSAGCYIDDRPIFELKPADKPEKVEGTLFTYSNIFRLERSETPIRVMEADLVENIKSKQSKRLAWSRIKNKLLLQSIALPLIEPENMGEITTKAFFFRVARMQLHDELEGLKDSDAISFDKLALQSGHRLSRAEGPMDAASCKESCLKDMKCRSYSICLTGRDLECVLSEVNLAGSQTITELHARRELINRSKNPSTFQLKVQSDGVDQWIALRVDRRCRLFRKLPVEMFTELQRTRTSLGQKVVKLVDSEQECAEKCLQMNVNYLRNMSELSWHSNQADDPIKVQGNLERNLKRWCAIFKFFDLNSTLYGQNLLKHGLLGDVSQRGLCLLPRRLAHDGQEASEKGDLVVSAKLSLDMDTFTFSYINLYECRDNVRMSPYSDSRETDAGETCAERSPVNNRKALEMKSIEECARACFMQTSGLRPFCKSFESVQFNEPELMSAGQDGPHRMVFCVFNSMSLADAKRSGLYDQIVTIKSDSLVAVKHYEPRHGHLFDDTMLRHLLTPDSSPKAGTELVTKLDFSLLVLMTVAAVSGFLAGVKLKAPLVRLWLERNDRTIKARRLSQNPVEL